jgi:branched-chain amino acid transport system substrate-binding protein
MSPPLTRRSVLAGSTALLAASARARAQSRPIRIGILAPYSGVFAVFGPKTTEDPVRLYLKQHNNKIAGHQVELIIADDQSKADVELQKAKELVEDKQVDIIIGLVNSAGALAVRDYLDQKQILTIIVVAGATEMTQSRKSPSIFRVSWASGQTEPAGAVLARQAGFQSMAAIGQDYVGARQILEPLLADFIKLGGTVPKTIWSPLNTADYSAYLTDLQSYEGKVSAITPMLFGADGVRFFNQYQEFGLKTQVYAFGDVCEQTIFLDQVGAAAAGTKAYWLYSPYIDTPFNNEFRTAFHQEYKRIPGGFSALSYAAMQFVEAAVSKAGDWTNKDALRQAMESAKITAPLGPLSFDKDHGVIHTVYLNEIRKGPDGVYSQIPMGPHVINVGQYQTLDEAKTNLRLS